MFVLTPWIMQFWRNKQDKMTIKDIAKEANVSVATVSRVINNYKWVSPELRKRILKIIERESYHPSYNASAMATGRSKVVVIIVPDIAGTFFAQFTSVAAKILKEAGYATVLVQTDNDAHEEESFFSGFFLGMADGVISVTDSLEESDIIRLLKPLRKKGKPVIFVDRRIPTYIADSIAYDTKSAIDSAMEGLLLSGHRRIGLILGAKGQSIITDKLNGYRSALRRWGFGRNCEFVQYGGWTVQTGITETEKLLRHSVTAIIAGNNCICEGAAISINRHGMKVGKEISLVGFEESDSDRQLFDQLGISTFQLKPTIMATDACDYILKKLSEQDDPHIAYEARVYPVDFVDRGSATNISKVLHFANERE